MPRKAYGTSEVSRDILTLLEELFFKCFDKVLDACAGVQDCQEKFHYVDGSIYLATTEFLRKEGGFVRQGKTDLYEIGDRYSVDIDEPEDLASDTLPRLRSSLND